MDKYPEKSCSIDVLVTHARSVRLALKGEKTQQRRDGLYAYPGEIFQLEGVDFRITSVERKTLGDIGDAEARREGYADLEAYRDVIVRMHKGMEWQRDAKVWVHSFERV